MKYLRTTLALTTLLLGNDALAVGSVSRACSFGLIPINLQHIAAVFFTAVGGNLATIAAAEYGNGAVKDRSWILEALTTDYISTRYYLYAQADVFVDSGSYDYYFTGRIYKHLKTFTSPGWEASEVSLAVKEDKDLKIFYENRGPLYSARAGNPDIVEYYPNNTPSLGFKVVGHHKYYDPVSKRSANAPTPETSATDCNLDDFGVKHSGIFDR